MNDNAKKKIHNYKRDLNWKFGEEDNSRGC